MKNQITLSDAIDMVTLYRNERPNILDPSVREADIIPNLETFSAESVMALLQQPDCKGFRVYYGMTPDKKIHAILVGADGNGKDILDDDAIILDHGERCPDMCPPASQLNP